MPTRFTGIRADGINNFDLLAFKNTAIAERINVEFRAEFINAFNHTHFSSPNTSPTSTAFGTCTGLSQLPRIVQFQFAIRLKFRPRARGHPRRPASHFVLECTRSRVRRGCNLSRLSEDT
jgi:hypothetical protein